MLACEPYKQPPRKILPGTPSLAYTVHPGRGPHLALVHGFLSSSRQWTHNLGALSLVCRPVTIDLLGHGHSPAPPDEDQYHPSVYVNALDQIRQKLKIQHWFLCGYSLGAGITVRYAIKHSDHVLGHLFTNSSSGFATAKQQQAWREDAVHTAPKILQAGAAAIERIPVHPKHAKQLPQDIYDELLADAERLSPVGIANTLLATIPDASVRRIAHKNRRPALLCVGLKESRFAALKTWALQHMPYLDSVELNTGNAVNMQDSAAFNQAACNFIASHTP